MEYTCSHYAYTTYIGYLSNSVNLLSIPVSDFKELRDVAQRRAALKAAVSSKFIVEEDVQTSVENL